MGDEEKGRGKVLGLVIVVAVPAEKGRSHSAITR